MRIKIISGQKKPSNFWIVSASLAICGLLLLAACAVNPVTGEQQLAFMSEADELKMGKQFYPQTLQMFGGKPPDDPDLQAYVNKVGRRLAAKSHRPKLPWEFTVVNDGMINAFALPGGKIAITRGLISKMDSEDELAAVLGHEIGHVTARHAVSSHARGTLVNLGVAGVGVATSVAGYGGVGSQVAGLAGNMLMMSYSRDQERQSDELGYQYMVQNGYNPKGMVRLFEIFQEQDRSSPSTMEAFFSSHPLTNERIATARRRVQTSDPRLVKQPMNTTEFKRALSSQKRRIAAYEAHDQGKQLMAQKRYSQAVESYWQGIQKFGRDGMMYADLAQAYYQIDRVTQARKAADRGARLSPDLFITNYIAGALNLETKQPRQALPYLQAANRIIPGHPGGNYLMGVAFEQSGRRGDAVRTYRQVVRMDPQGNAGRAAASRLTQMGYQP